MTSNKFDKKMCVVSFIDHDCCIWMSRLGKLIESQKMKAAVHIAWYSEVMVVGSISIVGKIDSGSVCCDNRRTATVKPCASFYAFSAIII